MNILGYIFYHFKQNLKSMKKWILTFFLMIVITNDAVNYPRLGHVDNYHTSEVAFIFDSNPVKKAPQILV